ncbi:peptide chain release factor N(5)-glutamine methyltransferase [Olsenella massiliensis]|uniref:peptide chain release factor N(5)-glutamine methyltransferase n=1 Tax=Olsenella massiliensis TaxID=1622075 RepID=UPI00071E3168|nr:peptide chain release factor N(5)-glutamine methyltransferase [Olsenella massiliensis]
MDGQERGAGARPRADEAWTVKRMLDWTRDYLEARGDDHPRLSAEWLISDACGLSRIEIYTKFDHVLTSAELDAMRSGVLRRGRGEPLQYVTGEMPFRHIVVRCEQDVLIPRPETEVLVDAALAGVDAARAAGHAAHVLELGCGSGCIACSVACERPGTRVVATDLSPHAVSLTSRNRDALGLARSIDVIGCDLAEDVDASLMGTFDVLVSNPPYIPSALVPTLPAEVSAFEPTLALDGGRDGLDVFRRILALAPAALRPGGLMCVELFEGNVAAAAELTRAQGGWASVEVRQDLTRRPRVLAALREGSLKEGGTMVERTKVLGVNQDDPSPVLVRDVAHVLLEGGVVVMPTDSVYGIGCAAIPHNPALGRIFTIKRRDPAQTLPWLVADVRDLSIYGDDVPAWAQVLARELWPGALTLVVKASRLVPQEYALASPDGGEPTIALRCPASALVRGVARELGVPLATTSANTHGEASATSGAEVEERLVRMADLTLDAGPAPLAVASTIVDCTGTEPRILREGAISRDRIFHLLGL